MAFENDAVTKTTMLKQYYKFCFGDKLMKDAPQLEVPTILNDDYKKGFFLNMSKNYKNNFHMND